MKRLQTLWWDDVAKTDITPREKGAEASRVLRPVRKRKQVRKLGRVDILRREDYAELELDPKVELIRSLGPLGLMHVEELLDEEVTALAGEAIPGAIGLSGSTVSRGFIQASAAQLREFQERDLSGEDVVAIVLAGTTFADATMVIALGITLSGAKRVLGFVETDTENARVLTLFLRTLIERGLDLSQGVLVILDGAKGLRSAVRKAFRTRALVQRCQWHKRENVVSYLATHEQVVWRQRLQRAYTRPDYDEALGALETLHGELDARNQSAAGSLAEGLDETLTLHRLGLFGALGRSLKTTNGLESVNALVEERCAKVDHWQNSSQRQRWLATALLDIEPRLRKVMGTVICPRSGPRCSEH